MPNFRYNWNGMFLWLVQHLIYSLLFKWFAIDLQTVLFLLLFAFSCACECECFCFDTKMLDACVQNYFHAFAIPTAMPGVRARVYWVCMHWILCVCVLSIHNVLNIACVNCQKSIAAATTATTALHALLQNCKWSSHISLLLLLLLAVWTNSTQKHIKPAPKCTHRRILRHRQRWLSISRFNCTLARFSLYAYVYLFAWKMTRFCLFMYLRFAAAATVVAVLSVSCASLLLHQTCHN